MGEPDIIKDLTLRILELENKKKELEDLLPWKQTEVPKLTNEIAEVKRQLHEIRTELNGFKNIPKIDESEEFRGFFS